jgi:hypothetical protein
MIRLPAKICRKMLDVDKGSVLVLHLSLARQGAYLCREEKRRLKRLERKRQHEEKTLAMKIALEERKMLIAHRKLESMRLLEELFNRVKVSRTTRGSASCNLTTVNRLGSDRSRGTEEKGT